MLSLNVRIRNRLRAFYVLSDLLTSSLAIFLFNLFRMSHVTESMSVKAYYSMTQVMGGQVVFTLALMAVYWLSGYYNEVDRRSRAQELLVTLSSAVIGALIIFFLAVVNDAHWGRLVVFENLLVASGLIFACVYAGRFLITRLVVRAVHNRHNTDAAVMIGTDADAASLTRRINTLRKGMGVNVTAFLRLSDDAAVDPLCGDYKVLDRSELLAYCNEHAVSHFIMTPRAMADGVKLAGFMRLAYDLGGALFLAPDVNTVAFAAGRQFNVVGEPLVCISAPNIHSSTANIKRIMDVVLSAVAMIVLSPLFAALAIGVKRDSRGPVFFRQTRLGLGGKPFEIIKFRSMVCNAEPDGRAMVTVDNDPRVTRFGHFLRKYRLDELPQFWNVLRGEMSLVGPRPERREFAEQIAARVPLYPMLYQVRPGITSWGMVRYGYASDVDQMVERLRYDLIYLESISISTDLKILLHTVNTVVSGRGK